MHYSYNFHEHICWCIFHITIRKGVPIINIIPFICGNKLWSMICTFSIWSLYAISIIKKLAWYKVPDAKYWNASMIQGTWCKSIGMQGESLFNIYSIIFVSSFDKFRYYELASWSHFQWHIFNISGYCTLLQKKRCGTYIATQHV